MFAYTRFFIGSRSVINSIHRMSEVERLVNIDDNRSELMNNDIGIDFFRFFIIKDKRVSQGRPFLQTFSDVELIYLCIELPRLLF